MFTIPILLSSTRNLNNVIQLEVRNMRIRSKKFLEHTFSQQISMAWLLGRSPQQLIPIMSSGLNLVWIEWVLFATRKFYPIFTLTYLWNSSQFDPQQAFRTGFWFWMSKNKFPIIIAITIKLIHILIHTHHQNQTKPCETTRLLSFFCKVLFDFDDVCVSICVSI